MENLFIRPSSWAFTKRSNSVAFVRSIVTDHGSGPNERNALALVASLHRTARRFSTRCRPLLVLNTIQFHSPFKTGYDFWAPFFKEHHLLFFTSLYSG